MRVCVYNSFRVIRDKITVGALLCERRVLICDKMRRTDGVTEYRDLPHIIVRQFSILASLAACRSRHEIISKLTVLIKFSNKIPQITDIMLP